MKRTMIGLCLGLLIGLGSVGVASAEKLSWDRNADDTNTYTVYACFTTGCTVLQTAAMKQTPPVGQTPNGVVPSWPVPTGKQGALAVSASDLTNNESGLSVSIPFDSMPPSIPLNPRLVP